MTDKHDQWLSDGDCNLCRRRSYCTKTCNMHKGYLQRKGLQQGLRIALNLFTKTEKSED